MPGPGDRSPRRANYRPPNPRPIRRPGEKSPLQQQIESSIESTGKFLSQAALAAFVAAGALVWYEKNKGPVEEATLPPLAIPTPEKREQDHTKLISDLNELPKILQSPEQLAAKAPKLAVALSAQEDIGKRCAIMRSILNEHFSEIVTISLYLNRHVPMIEDHQVRADFERQLREVLQMSSEQVGSEPERARKILSERMANSKTYKILQGCNTVALFFLRGVISKGIAEHQDKAIPIVGEIVKGLQTQRAGALEAARALHKMREALMAYPGR